MSDIIECDLQGMTPEQVSDALHQVQELVLQQVERKSKTLPRRLLEVVVTVAYEPTCSWEYLDVVQPRELGGVGSVRARFRAAVNPPLMLQAWKAIGAQEIDDTIIVEATLISSSNDGGSIYRAEVMTVADMSKIDGGIVMQQRYVMVTAGKHRLVANTLGGVRTAKTRLDQYVGLTEDASTVRVFHHMQGGVFLQYDDPIDSIAYSRHDTRTQLPIMKAQVRRFGRRRDAPGATMLCETLSVLTIEPGIWLVLGKPAVDTKMAVQHLGTPAPLEYVEPPPEPPAKILPEDEAALAELAW